jgi:hypothetical protein
MTDKQMEAHDLFDPVESPDADKWSPANEAARLVIACVQGCRDVTTLVARMTRPVNEDLRGVSLLVTPVFSVADNTLKLRKCLGREDVSHWPEKDRVFLRQEGRELGRLLEGPLRMYRNRRSAHHDAEFVADPSAAPTRPNLELIGAPLGRALAILGLLLNHERSFSWSRLPSDQLPNVLEVTTEAPVSTRLEFQDDGSARLLSVALTSDPRHKVMLAIEDCVAAYNELAHASRLPPLRFESTRRPRRSH